MNFNNKISTFVLKNSMQVEARKAYLAMACAATAMATIPNFAFAGALDGVLGNLGTVIITVIAIAGVIAIGKFSFDYFKGDGSIGKIVTAVLVMAALIGLVVVFMSPDTLQGMFGGLAKSTVETAADVTGEVLN